MHGILDSAIIYLTKIKEKRWNDVWKSKYSLTYSLN